MKWYSRVLISVLNHLDSQNVDEQRKDSDHLDKKESAGRHGKNVIWGEKVEEIVRNQWFVQVWERNVENDPNIPEIKRCDKLVNK